MEVLREIEKRLLNYPELKFEVKEASITIFPDSDDGFEVAFCVGNEDSHERYTVFYNGWHEHFSDKEEALNCFVFGLTSECRLKECSRGDKVYKWTVEYLKDGKWQTDSTTSLLSFPLWKKKKVRYLQNNVQLRG